MKAATKKILIHGAAVIGVLLMGGIVMRNVISQRGVSGILSDIQQIIGIR